MNRLALVMGLALLAGCATVKNSHVRPDYETVDKTQVKRLAVVTQPLPDNVQKVGELWSLIARRYVNQNRDFIAKVNTAVDGNPEDTSFKDLCVEGIEGILWLFPTVKRTGAGVEAAVKAQLLRCRDGQEVWGAEAAGSWPSEDERYKELTAQYTGELGPDVTPYVAPTFRLLSATLDTLPRPQLGESDVEEKIELGE
ncbi:MXAN_6521/LA_1396 family lipoprotein [Archangium violaceum]|uniref:MXAN_6521/LA_1396 family lipoprotein n=1 Tax=Archangium violaceum TaxID=83451 RepID=UPI00194FFDCA|nr:MXAN_6521/LA_1396 family lipoprotein [Archangium violaceum]QRN98734.1 MXAN_6521/LA_1396 family lipoprotein [Archangium violaceum]